MILSMNINNHKLLNKYKLFSSLFNVKNEKMKNANYFIVFVIILIDEINNNYVLFILNLRII